MAARDEPEPTERWLARFALRVRALPEALARRMSVWRGDSHDVPPVELELGKDRPEVTAAIMAHVLSRPDSIRQRAQSAATISGALAAALVVAAVSGLGEDTDIVTRATAAIVCLAILCFALSAALSVYAVAFPHEYKPPADEPDDGRDHYQQLVGFYEDYADHVRQKMRRAAAVAFVAVMLTALALVVEIMDRGLSDGKRPVAVLLSDDAQVAVQEICPGDGEPLPLIHAKTQPDELAEAMVELTDVKLDIEPGADGRERRACPGTILLPRGTIRSARAAE